MRRYAGSTGRAAQGELLRRLSRCSMDAWIAVISRWT